MQVELKQEKPTFRPIHLHITLDSEEELLALKAYFNASLNNTRRICEDSRYNRPEYVDSLIGRLWHACDKFLKNND
jgi:hypothetical protein